MSKNNLEILYRLLRDHLHVIGKSRTALVALESFIASLKELRCSKKNIHEQISGLAEAIKKGCLEKCEAGSYRHQKRLLRAGKY
jgi:hypothetical protein